MPEQRKYIYIHRDDVSKGKVWVNAHLLWGSIEGTINDYKKMGNEMRKSFPLAVDSKITCGRVSESCNLYGLRIAIYGAYMEDKEYPGWEPREKCEYKFF